MTGGLRRRRSWWGGREEDSPLEGGLNIVDAMLVFACGLMLALAAYWNVPLVPKGERVELKRGKEVTRLPEVRENLVEAQGRGKVYEKVGTVFRDPETGKLFMISSTGEEGGEE